MPPVRELRVVGGRRVGVEEEEGEAILSRQRFSREVVVGCRSEGNSDGRCGFHLADADEGAVGDGFRRVGEVNGQVEGGGESCGDDG